MTIDEIHQFEFHLEDGFAKALKPTNVKVYDTVTRPEIATVPSCSVKAIAGSYIEHRHMFPAQTRIGNTVQNTDIFDCYGGVIEVMAITNRTDDGWQGMHRRLLGVIRGRLAKWNLWNAWTNTIIEVTDIRPTGTLDTFQDQNDCDVTILSFEIVFNVNTQGIWPNALS